MARRASLLNRMLAAGFDLTTQTSTERKRKTIRPRCSCCEVAVICNVACHERGCPNIVRDEDEE